ncbi:GTPase IMAP family member 5 [Aplysia californica]|uniref:GTPase IMAP family member 5 n=1 Tax=Aplysia californica TaxID=6500 RepID=A0ABM0K816_APLCA|nr:GTPase IMAP family member 5 [Aplysia californica]
MASRGSDDTINLFLIGKTGHGKSSSGNSILGREAFYVSDNTQSDTAHIQVGFGRQQGRKVMVVDGPGTSETRMGMGDAAMKMVQDMEQGICLCPQGIHAMLLVMKYGNRFTAEELGTIETLKSVFGPTFVKDFCIVLFTHGDVFDTHNKRQNPRTTFEDWCHQQIGKIQDLFKECDNRVVLFNNFNTKAMEDQRKILFGLVDGLKSKGKPYTKEDFDKVALGREQLIVRANASRMRREIQDKIDYLVGRLNSLSQCTVLDPVTSGKFEQLMKDAIGLEEEINIRDKGTGVLQHLRQVVQATQRNIESQVKVTQSMLREQEKNTEMELLQNRLKEIAKRFE